MNKSTKQRLIDEVKRQCRERGYKKAVFSFLNTINLTYYSFVIPNPAAAKRIADAVLKQSILQFYKGGKNE